MNLQESIRKVLKEETSIQKKLLKSIGKIGVLKSSKMVGGINILLDIIGKDKVTKEQKVQLIRDIVKEYSDDGYYGYIDVSEYDIFIDLDINFTRSKEYTTEVVDLFSNGAVDIKQYPYDYEIDDYDWDDFKRKTISLFVLSESEINDIISKLIKYKKL